MRGSDFLSRTEADQNPEDLRRKRRETGEGRREGVSEEGEGGSTEGEKKKGGGWLLERGELQTDRCFSWTARKSKAQRGWEGEEEEEEEEEEEVVEQLRRGRQGTG